MSKYTSQDPDVLFLTPEQRVNYECDLLNFNVDANTQAYTAMESVGFLSDPSNILNSFKHPKDLPNTILLVLFFGVLFSVIIMFIIYILFIFFKVGLKKDQSNISNYNRIDENWTSTVKYMGLIFFLLILVYFVYNKLQLNLSNLVQMSQTGTANGLDGGTSVSGQNSTVICQNICSNPKNAQNICMNAGGENCINPTQAANTCLLTCQENPYANYANVNTKQANTTRLTAGTVGYIVALCIFVVCFLFIIILINRQKK